MAPTVHLVRHAQGYHNLCKENESLPDPSLTPFGEEQCQHLSTAFPYHSQVTKLVASPMRRAIHTCIQVFGQHQASGYRITAIDTLQELSDVPSDTGSRKEEILREFGDTVNLELVRETWTDKKSGSSPFEPTSEKIEARSLEARRTLRDIVDMESDEHVVVVTHGDYLHWLTNDWQINPWSSKLFNLSSRFFSLLHHVDESAFPSLWVGKLRISLLCICRSRWVG